MKMYRVIGKHSQLLDCVCYYPQHRHFFGFWVYFRINNTLNIRYTNLHDAYSHIDTHIKQNTNSDIIGIFEYPEQIKLK